MTVFNVLFDIKETPFSAQVATPTFYYKAIAYILVGIFVLGYFTWKSNKNKTYNFSYERWKYQQTGLIWGYLSLFQSF
jgi:hypothetical protein